MLTSKYPFIVRFVEQGYKDVILAEFPANLKVDLVVARQIVATRLEFTKNRKHYLIIDLSNVKEVSPEAKEFMQKPDMGLKNILGAAFIASNPVSAMIANIFAKTVTDFQAKFFSHKSTALNWIFEYKKIMENASDN